MENRTGILCLILVVPSTLSATMLAGVTRSMAILSLQVKSNDSSLTMFFFLYYWSLKFYTELQGVISRLLQNFISLIDNRTKLMLLFTKQKNACALWVELFLLPHAFS